MTTGFVRAMFGRLVRSRKSRQIVVSALSIGLATLRTATASDVITLEVLAGSATLENAIVETPLPRTLIEHEHFALTRTDTGNLVPVQVDRSGKKPQLLWIMRDKLEKGKSRRYRLAPTVKQPAHIANKPKPSRVSVADNGKRLLVKVGNKPVLAYNHATVPSPNPKHSYYARSGYIHPLYNPSGRIITDDFNPDHAHQHGIMLAWRKMTFEGRSTNGWDQKTGLGKVEHVKVDAYGGGPVFGFIKSRLRHVDLTAPGGPKTALDETWHVRVYAFDDAFLFDITSTQSCASPNPVTIDKYHYGGLMIRGHADWHKHRNYDFLTDEGKSKADGNQTRPRWVDLFGPVAGRMTGTTIMDHSSNVRFPQPVRLHPTMPYFCFTPVAIGSLTIEPGKPHVSRYRFYVHDGPLRVSVANRLWREFSNPPRVRIVTGR